MSASTAFSVTTLVQRAHQGPVVRLQRRLARVDARCVRLHRLPLHHRTDRRRVQSPGHRGDDRVHPDAVDAPDRRDRRGLAGRSHRPPMAADDLHPVVLVLQLHRRLLADLHVPAGLPHAARHRHGRRMAGRRGAGDGILADPLARLHERHPAGLVGPGLRARGRRQLAAVRRVRLARPVVDRHPAGARGGLRSASSSRSRRCGPRTSASRRRRRPRYAAAVHHLQAQVHLQHADRLRLDGLGLLRLLLDLGAVPDLPAARAALDAGAGLRAGVLPPT